MELDFFNNLIMYIIKYYNIIIDYTSLDIFSLFLCSIIVIESVVIILESSKVTELATKVGLAIVTGATAGATKSVVVNKVFKGTNNNGNASNMGNSNNIGYTTNTGDSTTNGKTSNTGSSS